MSHSSTRSAHGSPSPQRSNRSSSRMTRGSPPVSADPSHTIHEKPDVHEIRTLMVRDYDEDVHGPIPFYKFLWEFLPNEPKEPLPQRDKDIFLRIPSNASQPTRAKWEAVCKWNDLPPREAHEGKGGSEGNVRSDGGEEKQKEGRGKKTEGGKGMQTEGGEEKQKEGREEEMTESSGGKKTEGGERMQPEGGEAETTRGGEGKQIEGKKSMQTEGGEAKGTESREGMQTEGEEDDIEDMQTEGGEDDITTALKKRKIEGRETMRTECEGSGQAKSAEQGDAGNKEGVSRSHTQSGGSTQSSGVEVHEGGIEDKDPVNKEEPDPSTSGESRKRQRSGSSASQTECNLEKVLCKNLVRGRYSKTWPMLTLSQ